MRRFGTSRTLSSWAQKIALASGAGLRWFWAERLSRPWMCLREGCRKVNQTRVESCEECGDKKPVLTAWICVECDTKNHKGVKYCKKCAASADSSKDFWCCAACGKANRIDHIEDNSRCGYCEYDMAPLSMSEAEAMRIQEEQSLKIRMEQERFDTISPKDAEEQFGSETPNRVELPPGLEEEIPPAPVLGSRKVTETAEAETTSVPIKKPKIEIPVIPKFTLKKPSAAVSRIGRPKKTGIVAPAGPPGFDWMCREPQCGVVNGGDDEECTGCKTKISPDDWDCQSCAAKNHWSRSSCFSCSTPIPVSWQCRGCRACTSIYDTNCRSCHAPRPPVTPRRPSEVQASTTDSAPRRGGVRRADWYCSSCQQQNFAFRTECFSCGAAKDTAQSSPASIGTAAAHGADDFAVPPPPQQRDNNWLCRSCNSSNFRTRTTCWQCGKANSSVSVADDASAPQFEKEGFQEGAEDVPLAPGQIKTWGKNTGEWTCSRCFATNYKNRQECHKCGSVKTTISVPRKVMAQKPAKI